jgi:hypothetical protein
MIGREAKKRGKVKTLLPGFCLFSPMLLTIDYLIRIRFDNLSDKPDEGPSTGHDRSGSKEVTKSQNTPPSFLLIFIYVTLY